MGHGQGRLNCDSTGCSNTSVDEAISLDAFGQPRFITWAFVFSFVSWELMKSVFFRSHIGIGCSAKWHRNIGKQLDVVKIPESAVSFFF